MGEAILTVRHGAAGGSGSGGEKIGDIKSTIRTDLGDNWVLCNGACVSKSEYPDIRAMLDANLDINNLSSYLFSNTGITGIIGGNNTSYCHSAVLHVNGCYYIASYVSGYLYIYYSFDITSWKSINTGIVLNSSASIFGFKYLNNNFIIYGDGYNDERSYYVYASDINGTWTKKVLNGSGLDDVQYIDGKYIFVGFLGTSSNNYPTGIAYSTSLSATPTYNLNISNGYQAMRIMKAGSTYVMLVRPNGNLKLYYNTDPFSSSSSWSTSNTFNNLGLNTNMLTCDMIYDGTYYAVMAVDGNYSTTTIAYSTSLTGTWTKKTYNTSTSIYAFLKYTGEKVYFSYCNSTDYKMHFLYGDKITSLSEVVLNMSSVGGFDAGSEGNFIYVSREKNAYEFPMSKLPVMPSVTGIYDYIKILED